jgi:hypothetical protein
MKYDASKMQRFLLVDIMFLGQREKGTASNIFVTSVTNYFSPRGNYLAADTL